MMMQEGAGWIGSGGRTASGVEMDDPDHYNLYTDVSDEIMCLSSEHFVAQGEHARVARRTLPGSREPGHRTCSVPAPSRCRRTYAAVPCPFALSDPALSLQWPAVTEAIHSPRDAWGPEQQYMPCLDTANGQEHAAREQEKPLAPAKARVGIQCEPSPDGLRVTGITAGSSAAQSQIMVNDLLTIVNSEFLAGMEHEEMLQTLTGSAGSVLELTALREVDGVITTVYEQVVADASLAQEIQLLDLSSSFAPSIAQRHATSLRIAPQCQGVKSDSSQGELRFSAAPPGEHEPLRECETAPAAADDSSSAAKRGMLASAFQERNKPQVSRASAPADQVSLTDHAPVQVQRSSAPDPAHNPGPSGKQQPDSPATNKWRVRSVVAMLLLLLVMVLFVFGGGQSSAGGQDEAVGSVHVVAQPIAADNGTQAVASMWPSPPESVPLATPGDAPAADKQEQDERREEKMHVKEDHNHQQAIETHQNNETADTISKVASLSPGGAIVKKNTIEADCEEEHNGSDTEHMQGEKGSSAWASSSLAHHDVANDVGQNRADADVDVQQGFPTSGIPPVEAETEDAERGTREENLNIASEGTERAATPSDEKNVLNLQNDQRSRDQEALEAIAPADDSAVKTDVNNQAKASPADDTTPAAGEEDVALTQEASHAESANPVADCTTCVGSSSPTTNLIPQEMGRAQIDLTHEEALMGDLESSKNESPWTGQISEDGRSSSLNALEKKDEGSSTGPFNLSDASNESSSSVNGRHGQDIPVPTQTDGKRAAWLASMSSLLSLASSKNASGRNASQSDEGRTVSYMESLSRLLDTVSSQASNVTMMAGNESASYFKAVSSLLAVHSSGLLSANVSANGTHNASSFGDPWGRFLAGVFVRASNATSFVANDSASYLDSLSSLLTAYSPSQFVNASSSPVPTQTDGKRAAWLASMSSLLSLASSKNASGSDASSSSSRYLSASSNLNRLLGSFVQQSQGEPGTAELTGEIQGKSGKLIPFLMVSFLMMMLVGAICVCKRSRARVNTHSSQRALRSTAPQRRVADIDPGEQWRRSKFQPFDIPTQPEHDSLNPVAARVAKNPFMAKRLRSQHGELEPLRECETAPAAADGSSSAAKRGPKSSLAGGLALAVVVVWLMTKLNATRAILAVLGGMDSQRTTLMFTRMDADSSGGLSLEEVRLWFKDETFLSHLFSKADSNRDSLISFEESQQYEENERNLQLAVEKFEMSISHQELFQEMDTDGSGYLSQVELRHVLKEQGDYQDEDGLMTLFKNMDVDGDGGISFREADDYETKDAANSYISTYVNTVSDLLAKSIRGEEKGGEVQSAL